MGAKVMLSSTDRLANQVEVLKYHANFLCAEQPGHGVTKDIASFRASDTLVSRHLDELSLRKTTRDMQCNEAKYSCLIPTDL
jgi:hypothetical protein